MQSFEYLGQSSEANVWVCALPDHFHGFLVVFDEATVQTDLAHLQR